MDIAAVVDIGHQALWMVVLISAPLLGVSLAVGLVIGIIQAATSINEQTLSFIPKLAALAITLALVGGWQLATWWTTHAVCFSAFPRCLPKRRTSGKHHEPAGRRHHRKVLYLFVAYAAHIGAALVGADFFIAGSQYPHARAGGRGADMDDLPLV